MRAHPEPLSRNSRLAAVLLTGSALAAGCGAEDAEPPAAATPTPPEATAPSAPSPPADAPPDATGG